MSLFQIVYRLIDVVQRQNDQLDQLESLCGLQLLRLNGPLNFSPPNTPRSSRVSVGDRPGTSGVGDGGAGAVGGGGAGAVGGGAGGAEGSGAGGENSGIATPPRGPHPAVPRGVKRKQGRRS